MSGHFERGFDQNCPGPQGPFGGIGETGALHGDCLGGTAACEEQTPPALWMVPARTRFFCGHRTAPRRTSVTFCFVHPPTNAAPIYSAKPRLLFLHETAKYLSKVGTSFSASPQSVAWGL